MVNRLRWLFSVVTKLAAVFQARNDSSCGAQTKGANLNVPKTITEADKL